MKKIIKHLCYLFIALLLVAAPFVVGAQIITTVAGIGGSSYSGDGGAATSAGLHYPAGVVTDSVGNIYIADRDNHRVRKVDLAGNISTFAGTGTASFSGDGGAATAANLSTPVALAIDRRGSIYVSELGSNRVRKISPSGIISTFAGNGGTSYVGDGVSATATGLNGPSGILTDPIGNVYVSENFGDAVRIIDTNGVIRTFAGNGSSGFSGDGSAATSARLDGPWGIAMDATGNVYIADYNNSRVRMVNRSGIISTVVGNGTAGYSGDGAAATSASVNNCTDIGFDISGNLYITDIADNRIRKVNTSGIISTVAGNGSASYSGDGGPASSAVINGPYGITIDVGGNIFFADAGNSVIRRISAGLSACSGTPTAGTATASPASGGYITAFTLGLSGTTAASGLTYQWKSSTTSTAGPFTDIAGATNSTYAFIGIVDTTYYVCEVSCSGARDTSSAITLTFTNPSPNIYTIVGNGSPGFSGDGGRATAAILRNTDDVYFDRSTSQYFISDAGNERIRVVSPSGIISTFAGNGTTGSTGDGGPATAATFNHPLCMVKDAAGNLYVTEQSGHRIRKISPSGVITTFAGIGSAGFSGDGGAATAARLNGPFGIGIDRAGNIIFMDADNRRVRKITPAGIISTIAGTGGLGYSGDRGPATAATFNGANYLYVDGSDNIYISDNANHAFRKISPSGIITTFAGNGTRGSTGDGGLATAATVDFPAGITSDALGNVYLVTNGGNKMRVVNTSGIISTYAGTGTSGYAGDGGPATAARLSGPRGITSDAYNRIYFIGNNYSVRIIGFLGCAGTPTAGTAVSSLTSVCPGLSFSLSLTGAAIDSGISFQWQISSDGSTWTNISGQTNSTATLTQTAANYYRCVLTCALSSFTAASDAVRVGYTSSCYCIPVFNFPASICGIGTYTSMFRTAGEASTGFRDSTACATGGYVNRTSLSVTFNQYTTYAASLRIAATAYPMTAQAWVDFNDNGTFESAETIGGSATFLAFTNLSLSIPAGATPGTHRMRLFVASADTSGSFYPFMDPCGGYSYGEARDYTVTIVALAACSGTPTAGTAVSSLANACSTNTFTLSLSGDTRASGLSYQWQSSTDSFSWSNISGATTVPYSTTQTATRYYRCVVTCTGATDFSSGVLVTYIPVCYCTPVFTYGGLGCSLYDMSILQYRLRGVSGTGINDVTACDGSGYINQTAAYSVTLNYGTAYTATLGTSATYTMYTQTWIDFSNNGVFESSETVGFQNGITGVISYTVTIPSTVASGTYRMRVFVNNSGSVTAPSLNPCAGGTFYYYGEARDYSVTVIGAGCTGTPTAGVINATDTFQCSIYPTTLTLTGATSGTGISYQWQSSTDGTSFSNISGATSTVLNYSVTATVFIRAVVTCTGSSVTTATTRSRLLQLGAPTVVPISGPTSVCVSSVITLTSSTTGGTWSNTNPTIASVNRSGVVSGLTPGIDTIKYALSNACGTTTATYVITVNALPNPGTITGPTTMCVGDTATLRSSGAPGGVWFTPDVAVSIVSSLGYTTAILPDTANITYTVTTACGSAFSNFRITVSPAASAGTITGPTSVCVTGNITLGNATTGGSWSTGAPTIASVNTTGVVTGIAAGLATITYTRTTACGTAFTTYTVTVNTTASAGTISGPASVCIGRSDTLRTTGTGGTWISGNTTIASISTAGLVTGVSAGTTNITYAVSGSCGTGIATYSVTVSPAVTAGIITGLSSVCASAGIALTSTVGGGTWSSGSPAIASVTPTTGTVTGVSAGSAVITYTVTGTCGTATTNTTITVLPFPSAGVISGLSSVCTGSTITLTDTSSGGTWSTGSPAVASVSSTGTVFGLTPGTAIISYTVSNSCGTDVATRTIAVLSSATATAGAITGTAFACPGTTSLLSDTVTGGAWSSSNTSVATINSAGLVTGIATGTTTISYTVNTICGIVVATRIFAVNPLPNAGTITGSTILCPGTTTTLTNAVAGGSWSAGSPAIASVNATGVVRGNATGTGLISYSVTNSCGTATTSITITVSPVATAGTITGGSSVCNGATLALADSVAGGVWTSSAPTVASISAAGVVSGLAFGSATITYTVTNSCGTAFTTLNITVNALPNAGVVTGASSACAGVATTFATTGAAGVWSSTNPTVATVDAAGVVTGIAAGTTNIFYTATNGCGVDTASAPFTTLVTPVVGGIVGSNAICTGSTVTYSNSTTGGTWASSNLSVVSISTGGVAFGVANGSATISYTVTNTCGTDDTTLAVTVNTTPSAGFISGTSPVCQGATTALTPSVTGGVWSSNNTTIASITTAGVVHGVSGGTTTISYLVTSACGTNRATFSMTVNPLPTVGTISGVTSVCPGTTTTLTPTVTGGTWSSSTAAVASVNTAGVIRGNSIGTTTISYTLTNACGSRSATANITVNASPSAGTITGTTTACVGGSTTLADTVGGGTWTTSDATVATISATGVVTGIAAGTATITYTITGSCGTASTTASVTITTGTPTGTISGPTTVCAGSVISLTASVAGGTWSSSDNTIAAVTAGGVVTGVSTGSATITYTVTSSCGTSFTTHALTVGTAPTAGGITGTTTVCAGSTTTLGSTVTGGTWSSASPAIATVSSAGVVTGVSSGTSVISYTVTNSCGSAVATSTVTVIGLSSAGTITGPTTVCAGFAITLADTAAGGTWSSSNNTIATVSATGVVGGVAPGTVTIFYTITTACGTATASHSVTVTPSATAGSLSGTTTICTGTTTSLSTTGSTGGTWTSSDASVASVTTSGAVRGNAVGSAIISYTVTGSCGTTVATIPVTTINTVTAGTISGATSICAAATTALTVTATGGVWTSSNTGVAAVSGTGLVTGVAAGTATISYTVASTCGSAVATHAIRVDPAAGVSAISGPSAICTGVPTAYTDSVAGGVWSSSASGVATISTTGVLTGLSAGTTTISYTLSSACGTSIATQVVSVNLSPDAGTISGTTAICTGTTATLTSTATGGTWTSSNPSVATVSATGVVTGLSIGSAVVSYSVTNSCGTATAITTVSVNTLASAGTITGTTTLCEGTTTALASSVTGGTWSSSNNTIATVSATGVVGGVAGGTATISYLVTNTCGTAVATTTVTVNPAARASAISGTPVICTGSSATFTDSVSGGTWATSDASVASVSATGVVSGIANGTATISYTVTNSCGSNTVTYAVTVNTSGASVTLSGTTTVCAGATTTLTPSISGGTWVSSATGIASVSATGIVSGLTAGTAVVTYTVTSSCGTSSTTATITVNSAPSAGSISGTTSICTGATTTLSSTVAGGSWSTSSASTASVSTTGVVSGSSAGTATITYAVTNACGTATTTATVTVGGGSAASATISGAGALCVASSVTLTAASTGGTWASSNPAIASVAASTGVVSAHATGSVIITYTLTSSCGSATDTAVITVNGPASAGTLSGTTAICTGSSATLSSTSGGGVWTSSDAAIATVSTTGVVSGLSAGTAVITYTVTNACGSASTTATVTIGSGTGSAGTISGSGAVCAGSSLSLTATVTGGSWSSSDATIATVSSTGVVTGVNAGIANVIYTVTSSCGAVSISASVAVNARPTVAAITGATGLCLGTSTTLSNTTTGGTWATSNAAIASVSTTGVVTAITAGAVTISYTVTNSSGCTNTATLNVTSGSGGPSGTVSPAGSATLCGGSPVVLTVSSSTATTYQWYRNGTAIAGATMATYTATTNGAYAAVIGNGCGIDTPAGVNVVLPPNPVISSAGGRTLTTGSFATYQWYLNGVAIPGATGSVYVFTTSGRYTVSVTDGNGCRVTSAVYVASTGTTAVNTVSNLTDINIYPNPTTSIVYIEAQVSVNVIVLNAIGQVVAQVKDATTIDLSRFADGAYLIRVLNDNNELLKTTKVVKAE